MQEITQVDPPRHWAARGIASYIRANGTITVDSLEVCAALLAGDVDRGVEDFGSDLRSNRGAVIAQLPLLWPTPPSSPLSGEHALRRHPAR